ncbi:transmembrane protein [Mycobacterium tuberculosis]|nr:transmembrane protein [Mycobacterium tuberculosis]
MRYGVFSAMPATFAVTGDLTVEVGKALALKLLPATYVVLVLVVGYMLLTVTADLVNPIRLFQ